MPMFWGGYSHREPTCKKRPTWSFMRGGCRLAPNHAGNCKPGKGHTWVPVPL